MNPLKIIYAGTPEFAVPALQALIASKHEVIAVYTQPDRPAGRGRKVQFGPIKHVAIDAGVEVQQPISFKESDAMTTLESYQCDVMVVAAYGLILPQKILDLPKYGCLNIHGSLLPRWRGAAPIHRAIQSGDTETGVTIMQMAAGLDTGDMLLKVIRPITIEDTSQTIHDQLAEDGAKALLKVLDSIENLQAEAQDENKTCYAQKLNKAEAEIDWSKSAIEIDQTIRAFNPWPVAFTLYEGKPLRIFMSKTVDENNEKPPGTVICEGDDGIEIATGNGVLSFSRLQLPGKKAMHVKDFLNGRSLLGMTLPS